jgi:hypothetical protein
MYKGVNQYVVPLENGWGVCCGDSRFCYPVLEFETLEEAIDYARHAAIQFEGEVLIQGGEAHAS